MRVAPAVLDRAILAGLLLLPLAGVLASAALEGGAGLFVGAIVIVGAVLYAVVTWLAGARRDLRYRLSGVKPAPAEAWVEPLGRTAGRNVLKTLPLYGFAVLATLVDALVAVLAVAAGAGLVAALTALVLSRAEAPSGRLVRDPDGELLRF